MIEKLRRWRAFLRGLGPRYLGRFGLILGLGILAGLLALYGFVKLTDEVLEAETLALDLAVFNWLQAHRSPALDTAMTAISALGSAGVAVIFVLVAAYLAWRQRWQVVIALALATGGALLLDTLLKGVIKRHRPLPIETLLLAQSYSFPSGHATVSTAFYLYLAYLAWQAFVGWRRTLCVAALALLVLAIGVSRLYLGVHYLTDVVGGYLAGFIWVDAVILGSRSLSRSSSDETRAP